MPMDMPPRQVVEYRMERPAPAIFDRVAPKAAALAAGGRGLGMLLGTGRTGIDPLDRARGAQTRVLGQVALTRSEATFCAKSATNILDRFARIGKGTSLLDAVRQTSLYNVRGCASRFSQQAKRLTERREEPAGMERVSMRDRPAETEQGVRLPPQRQAAPLDLSSGVPEGRRYRVAPDPYARPASKGPSGGVDFSGWTPPSADRSR